MPTDSALPSVTIPDIDLFSFMFERDHKPYADDHGMALYIGPGILCADFKLQVIFVDGSTKRQLTYADILHQVKTFGIGLRSRWSWRKGDVLAIFRSAQTHTSNITILI